MSDTMLDILRTRAERISEDGIRLLKAFSGMHPINRPGDSIVRINPYGDQLWEELPPEGKQLQTRLLPEIDQFSELVRAVTYNLPDDAQQAPASALGQIRCAIEQNGTTWWKTIPEAVDGFRKLINGILTILEEYCGGSVTEVLAIPDTNALLRKPDLELWQFDDFRRFTLILVPAVLAELDKHKVYHRNPEVCKKAEKLIRKIKDYRRRGSLHTGVTVVKDRISLRTIASEPNMAKSLSWFDSNNADDRFLATTLDVIRANLGAIIFVVTTDINMQNKAEMAGIPFREIPG